MNRICSPFAFFLLLFLSIASLKAQTYTAQTLNKEPFKSAASLMQDYDGDGDLDVIVTRWDPAGIYWLENDDTKQFPAHPIITENLTFYLADIDAADFDNDGDIDYVVCFTDVDDGELAWFQRLDNDSYQKWTIATNKDFIEADVADFDGDGWMDIAAVGLSNSDETGRVYINQGNLFFSEKIVAQEVHGVMDADDIDGDGDVDLTFGGIGSVVTDSGSRILLNDGNGNFSPGPWLVSSNAGGGMSTSIGGTLTIVDLNDDGVKDILGFRSAGPSGFYFFDGADGFASRLIDQDRPFGGFGDGIAVFDIDGNDRKDIVVQYHVDNRVAVLYQTADGAFNKEYIDLNWDNCCNPKTKMSVGDLDGDTDLFFPEQGNVDEDISWYENVDGQLFKHQIYGQLDGINIPKLADWDKDGDLDIFVTVTSGIIDNTEDEIVLYENLDGEHFVNWRLHDAIDGAYDLELADIDGDGDLDIFATAKDADDLVWLRNDGFPANWVADTIFPEANDPLGIAADDLDGDGDVDVVLCSSNDDNVLGFRNDGSGSFSIFVVDPNLDAPREAEIADLDGDGDQDIVVVAAGEDNAVALYLNDGSGGFSKEILYTEASGRDIEINDWNQDGKLDIIACFFDSEVDVVGFLRTEDGFDVDTLMNRYGRVISLKVHDLDADDDPDLVVGLDNFTGFSEVVAIGINNGGEITDILPQTGTRSGTVTGIDVGDVNNDGRVEITFADFRRDDLVLLTPEACAIPPEVNEEVTDAFCGADNGAVELSPAGGGFAYRWADEVEGAARSDLAPGVYEYTVTDGAGCEQTDTVLVADRPAATIALSGEDTSCGLTDGSAAVSSTNDVPLSDIRWSNGETTSAISGLAGGVYSVTVTDANGCETTETVDIVQRQTPKVSLGEDLTIQEGESVTLDASSGPGITYEWSTGETTPSIEVTEPGTYAVTVTNEQGCSNTDTITISVDMSTSLIPLLDSRDLRLQPNPATDRLLVEYVGDRLSEVELFVYDVTGRTHLYKRYGPERRIDLMLGSIASGIYFIRWQMQGGVIIRRFIIQEN